MWRDIGLSDWLFDMDDDAQTARLPETVLEMLTHPKESAEKVAAARKIIKNRQERTLSVLRSELDR